MNYKEMFSEDDVTLLGWDVSLLQKSLGATPKPIDINKEVENGYKYLIHLVSKDKEALQRIVRLYVLYSMLVSYNLYLKSSTKNPQ